MSNTYRKLLGRLWLVSNPKKEFRVNGISLNRRPESEDKKHYHEE
jgi:hypothetical protein